MRKPSRIERAGAGSAVAKGETGHQTRTLTSATDAWAAGTVTHLLPRKGRNPSTGGPLPNWIGTARPAKTPVRLRD
jgi:hypothetical protein